MLERAVSYPFDSDNAVSQHIIGGFLWFFSFLIIPQFLMMGYHMEALKRVSNGDTTPPSFTNWSAYLIDGLKFTVVSIGYIILPVVFMAIAMSPVAFSDTASPVLTAVLAAIAVLVYFFGAALVPGAVTHLANTGSLKSAFDVRELKTLWLSREYIVASILYSIATFLVFTAFAFLAVITFGVIYVLYPFLVFYVWMVGMYVFGDVYNTVYTNQSTLY